MTNKAVIFNMHKALWGSEFGIRRKWLKEAGNRTIVINTPLGKCTFKNAKEFKRGAERKKKYHHNPDVPMIFFHRSLHQDIIKRDERKKKEALKEKSIPSSIMANPKMQEALKRIKSI